MRSHRELEVQAAASLQVIGAGNQTQVLCRAVCTLNCWALSSSRWGLHSVRALSLEHSLTVWACGFVVLCTDLVLGPGSEASNKLVPPQLFSCQLCPDGVWVLLNSRLGFPLYPWACKAEFFFHNGENLQVWSTPLCPLGARWRDQMTWRGPGRDLKSRICCVLSVVPECDRAVAGKGQTSDCSSP